MDTPRSAQVISLSTLVKSMFDDITGGSGVSESNSIDLEIVRWMTYAPKMLLNQDSKDVFLSWKAEKMFPR